MIPAFGRHHRCRFPPMKTLFSLCVIVGGFAFAILPSGSFAQSFDLALLSYNPSYTVWVNDTGAPGSSVDVYATMQTLTVSNQSPGLNLPATLKLFCVELGMAAPRSGTPYTFLPAAAADSVQGGPDTRGALDVASIPTTGIGSARAANLSLLYGYVFNGVYDPANMNLTGLFSGDAAFDQAVFQMAVWQLSHSDSFSLSASGPGFYLNNPNNSSLLAATQDLLTAVQANESSITPMTLEALHSEAFQDYALVPIPEPPTYGAILGFASFVFVLIRRRRLAAA